ncbi:MAG: LLM class F420-dependent oxidoreductase [Chloroflexi bacterium]|nr:LLM class F420-dependent oxidoreductase [Chloroflexota bacterium]
MQTGLMIHNYSNPTGLTNLGPQLGQLAQVAERSGFESIWLLDHLFQMEMAGSLDDPMLEAYTTLGYLAALTQSAQLGVMVTGVIYRYPAMLVKVLTTLDVLSGGRAWLGIGASWYEREARGLGIPFPSLKDRFEQLEETLQITLQMWGSDIAAYNGTHFQLAEARNRPQPLSQPHPPILIGGTGEKKTLRMVAQYANASNFGGEVALDVIAHKLTVLQAHCERLDRDYDSILKTVNRSVGPEQSNDEIGSVVQQLAQLGIGKVIFVPSNPYDIAFIERLGQEVLPAIESL